MVLNKSISKTGNHPLFRWLENLNTNVFFLILFLFQLVFIFQGVDIADEGFHSTFYQQIYHNPRSVEYNFMYWFSGITGGAWLWLFPRYGLLGLRLGGVMLNMLAVVLSYRLLKNVTRDVYLKLGLLLLVLINGAAVKDINYNNISALLFVSSILLLFRGLKTNKSFNFIIAGGLISLAVFSRLANLSGLALIIVIFYSGFFIYHRSISLQVKQIFLFISGFLLTSILVVGIMKITGQYVLFIDSVKLLKSMAGSGENTHDLSKLIKIIYVDYTTAIFKRTLPLILFVLLYNILLNQIKGNQQLVKMVRLTVTSAFLLLLIVAVFFNESLTAWTFLMLLFAAISLLACFILIIRRENKDLALISLCGTIMTLSLIAGADYGISASGSTALWIGLPVALDFFMGISAMKIGGLFEIQNTQSTDTEKLGIHLTVTPNQLKNIWYWGVYSCIVILVIHSVRYTYNDNPDRMKMTYPVRNEFLRGVYTTSERAEAINDLLEVSAKYIKPNDFVIAYKDIPLYYSLTQTVPFIKNSWPSLYTKGRFDYELHKAVEENQILPTIIYQKVQTIPGPLWPDSKLNNSAFNIDSPKNEVIKNFIEKYEYKVIWENIAFKIYTADSKALNKNKGINLLPEKSTF